MDETPAAQDLKLDFIVGLVLRSLKLKQDSWQKCVFNEDNVQVLQDFLDQSDRRTLVVSTNSAGLPEPAASVSAGYKHKTVYFIKKDRARLRPESLKDSLVCGDVSHALLDQVSAFVQEVGRVNDYMSRCLCEDMFDST